MSEPDERVSDERVSDERGGDPQEEDPPSRTPWTQRAGWMASLLLVVALAFVLLVVGTRVGSLADGEVNAVSELLTVEAAEGRVPMVEADLRRDDEVVFELCSSSELDPSTWDGALSVAILRRTSEGDEDVVRSALDAGLLAAARRSSEGTCLNAGQGVIELDGTYVTELAWQAPLPEPEVRFRARTLGHRSLGEHERNLIFGLLLLSLLLTLTLYLRPLHLHAGSALALKHGLAIAAAAALLLYGFMRYVTPYLPGGAVGGLISGLSMALFEVVLAGAFLIWARDRLAILGVGRREAPAGAPALSRALPFLLLVLAPLAGLALYRVAGIALHWIPATGEAPIEAFVSSPSGMLSFAALAVVAPIAEEVFFRGLVYGVLRGDGTGARPLYAFVGAWAVFALVHLPQTWGSWGGLASIAIAALGFTALRAASGSIAVPAVAHLVYNGLLSAQALLSASN